MNFLGYQLKHIHNDIYDASDVYWNEPMSKITEECKKQGFKIIMQGGMKSCYSLKVKKVRK